jgi:phosphatidylserine decarboxylase
MAYEPVVEELIQLIQEHGWKKAFEEAVQEAHGAGIPEMDDIKSVDDYLQYVNDILRWVPTEDSQGSEIYNRLCKFGFVLDQPALMELQNPITPVDNPPPLTTLSAWMVRYANAMGSFLDTPESLTPQSLETFRKSPSYNLDEYIEPHGGWRTFNELFARNFKPGYRPVAAISDPQVIVSPADSTFDGQWEIRPDSQITLKNLHWRVGELMTGSPYSDRFTNGHFMHAFLSPADYHRQHAPVGGTVLEARVIPGQVYLQVVADDSETGRKRLKPSRTFDAPDNPGYQFAQARGLIVLDTPIGLVAVLPIGMCQVSSVIITAEPGVTLRKGEELSYFQFGGSDIVVLFESKSNVNLTAQVGTHYRMGTVIGNAFPA